MQKFPNRKKYFVQQLVLELFILLGICLTIASLTQNFLICLSVSLLALLARSYFYVYKIFNSLRSNNFLTDKPNLTYGNLFEHLNFAKRRELYIKNSYLKLIIRVKKDLELMNLPMLVLDVNAKILWQNKRAKSFLNTDYSPQIKTKILTKLQAKFKKTKKKSKLKIKFNKFYFAVRIAKLNANSFFVTLEDLSKNSQVQKQEGQKLQNLQEVLVKIVAKNASTIASLENMQVQKNNANKECEQASLQELQRIFLTMKSLIENLTN